MVVTKEKTKLKFSSVALARKQDYGQLIYFSFWPLTFPNAIVLTNKKLLATHLFFGLQSVAISLKNMESFKRIEGKSIITRIPPHIYHSTVLINYKENGKPQNVVIACHKNNANKLAKELRTLKVKEKK